MPKVRVAILGASGLVSQRMQQRLSMHPWFELAAVAGQLGGTKLSEIDWFLDEKRPEFIQQSDIRIFDIHDPKLAVKLIEAGAQIVFSALPSQPALHIEKNLNEAGLHVFSNASAYRMHPEVALVVADVNPEALIRPTSKRALHACATNCTLIPVLHPLSILSQYHNINRVVVRSEQALSGAGWKLLHNEDEKAKAIEQEIPGEAEKIIEEAEQILGIDGIEWDVQCKRVDEKDGHIVNVEVHLADNPTYDSIKSELDSMILERINPLPSQPQYPMILIQSDPLRTRDLWMGQTFDEVQPSLDLKAGMTTTVQLKTVESGVVYFKALSHNTIRGAAGGVVLLAELAHHNNLFSSVDLNPPSSSSES
ncbi:MAG: hypothetical protein CMA41_04680 [Euryarchaeota archaeon]|jgi:aspartate-semialdehyde dehydrogenase|nr:hypothetical protein [Euryarchaeota archaeon]MBF14429.1 hypothetical protein [Euryarchaeota archaeon]CAI8337786.1 MAG: Aspartate-semialdehyde dehydrogenase [Euryarchaeota archaeon UBA443]|tara:strand:+ start:21155 stop:22252 length:1098 start_codon:yes stop_codon:yes gene_type:complete